MKLAFVWFFASFAVLLATPGAAPSRGDLRFELYFEPNLGQFPPEVRFKAVGPRYSAYITDHEIQILGDSKAPSKISFAAPPGHKVPRKVEGLNKQIGITNYMRGADRSRWILNVPSYARAHIENVYRGIDAVFYASPQDGGLEYDFIVRAGADASAIRIGFDPAMKPRIHSDGEISLSLSTGELRHRVPLVHQKGTPIAYKQHFDGRSLRFEIGEHDSSQPLTIDPTIVYSTYFPSQNAVTLSGIAVDSTGAAFFSGTENQDAILIKIGAQPVQGVYPRIFTQVLGGTGIESAGNVALDSSGAAYLAGATGSSDFPVLRAFQVAFGGVSDGFIAKFSGPADPSPYSLVYSSFLGGSQHDTLGRVAVTPDGAAHMIGYTISPDLPTLNAALPIQFDSNRSSPFVCKIASAPSTGGTVYPLLYLTGIGQKVSSVDGLGVDSAGAAYVLGNAQPNTVIPILRAFQPAHKGYSDGFVMKISGVPAAGTGIYHFVYSTFLGGAGNDTARGLAVDRNGAVTVVGATDSYQFPVVRALQSSRVQPYSFYDVSGFVTRIAAQADATGTYPLEYSSYFGGTALTGFSSVALDPSGAGVTLSGYVSTLGTFPEVQPWFPNNAGGNPAVHLFLAKMTIPASGTASIDFATKILLANGYSSSVTTDSQGGIYLLGYSQGRNVAAVAGSSSPVQTEFAFSNPSYPFAMKLTAAAATPSVIIQSDPPNGVVTVSGSGCNPGEYEAPIAFFWPVGTACQVSGALVREVRPIQWVFNRWADTASAGATRTIVATGTTTTYAANFDQKYAITVYPPPSFMGSVSPEGTVYQSLGSQVAIRAVAAPGYTFSYWIANAKVSDYANANTTVTPSNQETQVIPSFAPLVTDTRPSQFVPVSPCRISDTRPPGINVTAQGPIAAKRQREFVISGASICGIPSNATAYSLNVTVVPRGPLGYLSIWPTGQSQPVVSTLNSLDGRVKANAVVVPAGTNGRVSIYVTDEADVVLDINGYFVWPQANSLAYFPIAPCRAIDTRTPTGAPVLPALQIRTVAISSKCGIPANAQAFALNATVIPETKLGFLRIQPAGAAPVTTSTLNAVTGTIVANAAIMPVGNGGAVDVYATENTHLLLDVNGYFAPPSEGGLNFYPMAPCRTLDTRLANNAPPAQKGKTYLGSDFCNAQPSAKVLSLNATVLPRTASYGYLTLFAPKFPNLFTDSPPPLASTLNALDGAITSNAGFVGTVGGFFAAFSGDSGDLLLDINGFFAP